MSEKKNAGKNVSAPDDDRRSSCSARVSSSGYPKAQRERRRRAGRDAQAEKMRPEDALNRQATAGRDAQAEKMRPEDMLNRQVTAGRCA